jgi:hypothetical protein
MREGFFQDSKLHGLGRETQGDFITFGLFEKGEFVKGYALSPTSLSFGDFRNGVLHGSGFRLDISGTFMYGQFADDLLQGIGLVRYNDDVYFGEFEDGDLKRGVLFLCDLSTYVGTFRCMSVDGEGTLFLPDGTVQEGVWCLGELVQIKTEHVFNFNVCDSRSVAVTLQGFYQDMKAFFRTSNVVKFSSKLLLCRNALWKLLSDFPSEYVAGTWLSMPRQAFQDLNLTFFECGSVLKFDKSMLTCEFLYPSVDSSDFSTNVYSHFQSVVTNDNVLNGPTTLCLRSGDRVVCSWKAGVMDEEVVIHYRNTSKFVGKVDEAYQPLYGTLYSNKGKIHVGSFNGSVLCGEGFTVSNNGTVLKGTWNMGEPDGLDFKILYDNGTCAIYHFIDGRAQGDAYVLTADGVLQKMFVVSTDIVECVDVQDDCKKALLEAYRRELYTTRDEYFFGQVMVDVDASSEVVRISVQQFRKECRYFVRLENDRAPEKLFYFTSPELVIPFSTLLPSCAFNVSVGIEKNGKLFTFYHHIGDGEIEDKIEDKENGVVRLPDSYLVALMQKRPNLDFGIMKVYSLDEYDLFVEDALTHSSAVPAFDANTSLFTLLQKA